MNTIDNSQHSINNSVNNMNNYFLYLKIGKEKIDCNSLKDIYCFNNNKIIAVDKNSYSKSKRAELQTELSITPYYITQNIFKEFIFYVVSNKKYLIRNIDFLDETVKETDEYNYLISLMHNRSNEIYSYVNYMIDEFDTDVSTLVIRFSGYDFSISSKGVIDTFAPNKFFYEFLNDQNINKLILGLY